jgi:predicted metal-dependent hydrolase
LVEKKKTTKKVAKKTTKKTTKKVSKKIHSEPTDSGIVIIDDDLTEDKETADEERRAYLEEARSQEASSD